LHGCIVLVRLLVLLLLDVAESAKVNAADDGRGGGCCGCRRGFSLSRCCSIGRSGSGAALCCGRGCRVTVKRGAPRALLLGNAQHFYNNVIRLLLSLSVVVDMQRGWLCVCLFCVL
jgi:hypothetical protein